MQRFWVHYRENERESGCIGVWTVSNFPVQGPTAQILKQSYLNSITRKYGKYILWLQFLSLGGSETSPGHYQNWIYDDVMTNDYMAGKTRRTIQINDTLSSFSNLKAAFSHKALHTIQLSDEVSVECEKKWARRPWV